MDSVDVSIIIVTFNTCDLLRHALTSISESDNTLSREVIVVDNGSDDETMRMISDKFPFVIYLKQPRNRGFAQANNRGVRHARGSFLCLLNSDARLKPGSLSKAVSFMRSNPKCGVVGAQLMNIDHTPQNSIANFPNLITELLNKSLLRSLFPDRYPGKNQKLTEPTKVESVVGAFLLTRHDLWIQLAGLNERFLFFLEETDYCLRVHEAGFSVYHLPQVEVWHDQGQTAKKTLIRARVEYWRSRYTYFNQHHALPQRIFLRCGLLTRLSVVFLINLLICAFVPNLREKCLLQGALLLWHLKGCPANGGLNMNSEIDDDRSS